MTVAALPGVRATAPVDLGFRPLFDAHLRYVWNSLKRLGVADRDVEDLAIEVFFRAHRRLDVLDPNRPVRPWLFAFAVRVASEHRRLARNRHEQLGAGDDAASHAIAARAPSHDARETVMMALTELDLDKRVVLVMHDLDGFSIPEIARELECPEGTLYSRLRVARDQFTAAIRRLQRSQR